MMFTTQYYTADRCTLTQLVACWRIFENMQVLYTHVYSWTDRLTEFQLYAVIRFATMDFIFELFLVVNPV